MGYLLDARWEEGQGLEDLSIWGTGPLFQFLEIFDETYVQGQGPNGGDEDFGCFLYYQMKNILLDMDQVIDRFADESQDSKDGKQPKVNRLCKENAKRVYMLPDDLQKDVKRYLNILEMKVSPDFEAKQTAMEFMSIMERLSEKNMSKLMDFLQGLIELEPGKDTPEQAMAA